MKFSDENIFNSFDKFMTILEYIQDLKSIGCM